MKAETKPNIYSSWDHVEVINQLLVFRRSTNPNFSVEYLARKSGVFKRSLLSLVLQKKRKLQKEKVIPLGDALGLNTNEKQYLYSLTCYNQSKDASEARFHLNEIVAQRPMEISIAGSRSTLLNEWFYLPLIELIKLPQFKPDVAWIAKAFKIKITSQQILNALSLFKKLKIVEVHEESWKVLENVLSSSEDIPSPAIKKYHLDSIKCGEEALINSNVEEREFIGLNFPISKEEIPAIKSELRKMCNKLILNRPPRSECQEIAKLNVQFFILTQNNKCSEDRS